MKFQRLTPSYVHPNIRFLSFKVRQNISYMRGNLTEHLWSYSQAQPVFHQVNWTKHVMKKLKVFENDLVLAMRKSGWDGAEGEQVQQWTLTGALFYSIIVITTIGECSVLFTACLLR